MPFLSQVAWQKRIIRDEYSDIKLSNKRSQFHAEDEIKPTSIFMKRIV
ncbi:MAG TPA: hypothetical protein VNM69_01795 [Bacillus sp. (in: firmicutes)]|nr:hypothetical protein [Bacillus sp. (in: firmicutes)]